MNCINCGSIRFRLTVKKSTFDGNKSIWECKNPSCMQKFTEDQVKEHGSGIRGKKFR